jgi:prepilin-type N-terminal cleavage/methylation domain-containing protein
MRLNLQDARNDDGFTLMEVVMSVAILGIITVALTGVVLQHLKVSRSTQTRLSESTDQQFVSAYWQQDVSSLGRRGLDAADPADPVPTKQSVWLDAAAPDGCGNSVPGDVVVAFAWNEYVVGATNPDNGWDATSQEVAYVADQAGSQWTLVRVRCDAGAVDRHIVAHHLVEKPEVTCDPSCGPALPRTVSIKLKVQDLSGSTSTGYTTTLTADRRQG